jgi:hypothetical protein
MELPAACNAVLTFTDPDAWAGHVDCGDQGPRIEYGMGLIQSLSASGTEVWTKREWITGQRMDIGLLRGADGLVVIAFYGWASFRAAVKTEKEADVVVDLLRTVGGPCPTCERARVAPTR